jgi:hypothetical protein
MSLRARQLGVGAGAGTGAALAGGEMATCSCLVAN